LTGIEFTTDSAQARQRETRSLPYRHSCRPIFRHPDRELRQCAVGLTDGQTDFVATVIAPSDNDYFATTGMKPVTDNDFIQLMVGIMKLLRPSREWSSGGAPFRRL
jgi:hypothetical protein